MTKNYLAAIEVISDGGANVRGNRQFNTDEPLSMKHLEEVKKIYCEDASKKGLKCSPENAVIYAVIPLDA